MTTPFRPARPEYRDNEIPADISGINGTFLSDAYYYLISASWWNLFILAFSYYLIINLIFGFLFWIQPDGISNAREGSFADTFYFSVQTFSTIGYGSMSPATTYTHILVVLESFIGLVGVALATGIIFAKFSRPNAKVAFSEVLTIHMRDEVPHLHLRIANQRRNQIINAKINLSVLIEEMSAEGHKMRRFHPLTLVRDEMPMFAIMWTVMHRLDESSPLRQVYDAGEMHRVINFVISFEGMDSTFLQTVQAVNIYPTNALRAYESFEDMIEIDPKTGTLKVMHEKLSMTRKLPSGIDPDDDTEAELKQEADIIQDSGLLE